MFMAVIAFGIYILFTMDDSQAISLDAVTKQVNSMSRQANNMSGNNNNGSLNGITPVKLNQKYSANNLFSK